MSTRSECQGCGREPANGNASINGEPYCHPDSENELDCYHMATVYGWGRAEFADADDQYLIALTEARLPVGIEAWANLALTDLDALEAELLKGEAHE